MKHVCMVKADNRREYDRFVTKIDIGVLLTREQLRHLDIVAESYNIIRRHQGAPELTREQILTRLISEQLDKILS